MLPFPAMRRLLSLLLLAACVSEPAAPSAPSVWYSAPVLPELPRVGVIDRERIIVAYYDSGLFQQLAAATTRERQRAERAGDSRTAAVLRLQERAHTDLREMQLEGRRGLMNIMQVFDGVLPEIAFLHGVDIIVEKGTWTTAARNVIDVTDDLVERLPEAEG